MDFPGVRETLERWGLLQEGSSRSSVAGLGVSACKVVARDDDPVRGVMKYLERHPADVIVLGTHRHDSRFSWLRQSIAEPVARDSGQATLFVPEGIPGFVSAANGSVHLQSILVPVASSPEAHGAVEIAARLVRQLECASGTFTILHVGESSEISLPTGPEVPGWSWNRTVIGGEVIHGIVETALLTKAGLIVMATDGRNGFLDALRGSHSERVLHQSPCPLLAVPAGSRVVHKLEATDSLTQ